MAMLSKSKLVAYRQCPKRLWLEVHRRELREDSSSTQASFAVGHEVGEVARRLYDPNGSSITIDVKRGVPEAIAETRRLIEQRRPIFEAGFSISRAGHGAIAFADVLLPVRGGAWRMVEVKSSTQVKPYHLDDVAIQYHVATGAGVTLKKLQLACIDSSWTYPGGGDYTGLLKETDVTESAQEQQRIVSKWIREAHRVVDAPAPPDVGIGDHCSSPFQCGFSQHCRGEHEERRGKVKFPVQWLPGRSRNVYKQFIQEHAPDSMREVPDELLTAAQLRVKTHTLAQSRYFDAAGAAGMLAGMPPPLLFLDFETIAMAVPVWPGTHPYDKVPFQFSLHTLRTNGSLGHSGFLDLSGNDPSEPIARALIEACGSTEPIFAYHKSFEASCLEWLALRLPKYARRLRAIRARLVDLEPVATLHYYHPEQQGSWSIKKVLPTIAADLRYDTLDEVQDGGAAQLAYAEAVHLATSAERRAQIHERLWAYCRLDTFAMVRLWAMFAGRERLMRVPDTSRSKVLEP